MLAELTTEEIHAELERRKQAFHAGLRAELDAARKLVRDLEAKLGEAVPAKLPGKRLTAGEKAEKVLSFLDGKDFTGAAAIESATSIGGNVLRLVMDGLVSERRVVREGRARGTKYRLA